MSLPTLNETSGVLSKWDDVRTAIEEGESGGYQLCTRVEVSHATCVLQISARVWGLTRQFSRRTGITDDYPGDEQSSGTLKFNPNSVDQVEQEAVKVVCMEGEGPNQKLSVHTLKCFRPSHHLFEADLSQFPGATKSVVAFR